MHYDAMNLVLGSRVSEKHTDSIFNV